MIKIDSFVKKNGGNSSSSNGGGFANNSTTTITKELQTHKLWGQSFNGTQDVDGDITVNGNVDASGTVKGDTGSFAKVESESITNVGNISTDTIDAASAKVKNGDITTLLNETLTSTNITTDYLTVTKAAHFWELIVDKITSTRGAIIVSPANAVVEDVEVVNNCYVLYWRAKDNETGKEITNDFRVDDQIICQSFNAAEGDNFNVSNKYYWALVTEVGRAERDDKLRGEKTIYNFIVLSDSDVDKGNGSVPEIGDNIAVLGNRNDESRQNAIIISSTNGEYMDSDIQAPSIVQYKGIKTFELKTYRYNVIAANGNTFVGNFKVVAADGTIGDIESGKDGKGVRSISARYMISDKNSGLTALTVWNGGTSIPPTMTTAKPYLWSVSRTYFTDGTNVLASNAVLIGSLGKQGATGAKGDNTQYITVVSECSSEDYNTDKGTGHSYTSNVYMDGHLLTNSIQRGHTLIVVDPTTKTIESKTTFDTYGEGDDAATRLTNATTATNNLITAIDNVANDKIIIIVGRDATSCLSSLRTKLSEYNSNIPSSANTWQSQRYSHAIIIFKHSNREHQCFEKYVQFKQSSLTVYYTTDNMSVAGLDGNNGIMDKLSISRATAIVDLNDTLNIRLTVGVQHIDGDKVTFVSDLSKYKFTLSDSNGISVALQSTSNTVSYVNSWTVGNYSKQASRQTYFVLTLKDSSNNVLDSFTFNVTFDAGAVFTVGTNAITSAVQQSKGYTDGQVSKVTQTAESINSRVTAIEGDYITESELTQKANEINISITDSLKNKTGIDISTGKIILNAENTTIKGNLNLTDSSNGMTVYDNNGNPVINLQPKNIASIDSFTKDTIQRMTLPIPVGTKGGSSIKIYTSKSEAFSLSEGNVIQLDSMTYTLIANDGTTIYPSDLYLNGGVEIFNRSNELVFTYAFQFTRANLYGSYKATAVASYRVPTADNYTYRIYITTPTTWASSYTLSGTATARKQVGNNVQSYVGANGAFFHNSPNKMIYNSNEALRLQYGMNGIAWVNDEYTGNKSMQVIAGFRSEGDGTYTPLFLPFYNYTPVITDVTYIYQQITNIGSSRYAHVIQPFTDRGYLLIDRPAMDNNGNNVETWFILPNSQLYLRDGYMSLPIGYTIKIINNLQGLANLYVTPYSTGKDLAKIYTAENTKASYLKLTGDMSMKTFMYVGGYGTENGQAWRVID